MRLILLESEKRAYFFIQNSSNHYESHLTHTFHIPSHQTTYYLDYEVYLYAKFQIEIPFLRYPIQRTLALDAIS
jgi:hypothetical protein